jgi:hypothetical protein
VKKFRSWLIEKLLKHDGMVAVPEEWQKEYVKLAGDKVRSGQTIAEIIKEYNKLLEDYFNKCNMKELKALIKDAGVTNITADSDKDALVIVALNEYKMKKEK